MAKATIRRACGHLTAEQFYGSSNERTRREAWLRTQVCRDCMQANERQAAEQQAEATGLPALVGSEKQIAWATTIRATLLAEIDALIADWRARGRKVGYSDADLDAAPAAQQQAALLTTLRAQTEARYWIDHRSDTARTLLQAAAR